MMKLSWSVRTSSLFQESSMAVCTSWSETVTPSPTRTQESYTEEAATDGTNRRSSSGARRISLLEVSLADAPVDLEVLAALELVPGPLVHSRVQLVHEAGEGAPRLLGPGLVPHPLG